jgi:hypothetical protein
MPAIPKEEAERNKKILAQLLKLPHNKECADCTAKGPTWCPTNWGVFVRDDDSVKTLTYLRFALNALAFIASWEYTSHSLKAAL